MTTAELKRFVDSAVPRKIPAGLHKQEIGDIGVLVPVGLFIALMGLIAVIGVSFVKPLLATFFAIPVVIGGLIVIFSRKYVVKKRRVWAEGELLPAKILDVVATNVKVNEQLRHKATIVFERNGHEQTTTCNLYGPAAKKADDMCARELPVQVLIDPTDVNHVVCPDLVNVHDE